MRLDKPLDDLLGTAGHLKVLRALFGLPEGVPFSGREIARRAGLAPHRTNAILSDFADNGLVLVSRAPRLGLYQLNHRHTASEALSQLLRWEANLKDQFVAELRDGLLRLGSTVKTAILFGSIAWGEMTPRSDVDLLVLAPRKPKEVDQTLEDLGQEIRARFGNRLEPLVLAISKPELARGAKAGKRLWRRILENGVPVISGVER